MNINATNIIGTGLLRSFVMLTVVCSALLVCGQAWGHASANRTSPNNGDVLSQPPKEISIQFNEPARLLSLSIQGADEAPIAVNISAAKSIDGLTSIAIPSLKPQHYSVTWRALGLDGHATSGQFSFVIDPKEN